MSHTTTNLASMDSPPLARFLRSLGKVQHHLHTIVVGLSAVEKKIATKPDNLDIAWKAHDTVGSAREARRFLLRATLIFIAEELGTYATHVMTYETPAIDTDALPEARADRIRALAESGGVNQRYLTVAALLVTHWRNRIVHRDSHVQLTRSERQCLLTESESIRSKYKGIDVSRLLQDFESDTPTLKDVTVLLAMSVTFVRQIDSRLTPTTSGDVRRWLEAEELLNDVLKFEKQSRNDGHSDPRRRARQYLLTKAPSLAEAYYKYGSSEDI